MKLEFFVLGIAVLNLVIVIEVVRRRRMHEHFAMLWLAIGFGGILLALLRPVIDRVSNLLGVKYGTSLVFTVAIFFLFTLAMYISTRVTKLETQIEQLAEHIAFLESDDARHVRSSSNDGPAQGDGSPMAPAETD